MDRRGLLRRLAGLPAVGVVGAGAGCTTPADPSGPRSPPRSPESTETFGLTVADFTELRSDAGTVHVRVTVENYAGTERTGTVVAEVATGEGEVTVRREVTVPSSERVEVTLETDLPYEEFRSLSVRIVETG